MIDDTNMMDQAVQSVQEVITDKPAPVLQEVEAPQKETIRESNLRILRERAEAAERKMADMEQLFQTRQKTYQEPQQQYVNEEQEFEVADGDLIEGKDLKRILQAERKRNEQQIQQLKYKSVNDEAERKMVRNYSDANEILSDENIKNFKAIYPEEFASAQANPDAYSGMKTAYTLIKNLGIADKPSTRDVDRRLEQNKLLPRSAAATPSSTSDTPLSRVGDFERRVLTDDMKEKMRQNLAQAKQALKYRRE